MAGAGAVPARHRGNPRRRLGFLLADVLGQKKTLARRYPGVFHTGLFWGFALLFIGTVLATLDWDTGKLLALAARPLSGSAADTLDAFRFLGGSFYLWYELVLDTAGLALVLGLFAAMYRRYVVAPHYVAGAWDLVLWSLLIVNLTGFLVEGLRLVMAPVAWSGWSWVGQALANLIFLLPSSVLAAVPPAHFGLWLLHGEAALAFIAVIPYTNMVHLVSTATNTVLRSTEAIAPGAALQPVDIESAEQYGAATLAHFTWKQRLGFDSCLRCGRCETVCPAYLSGTPLNPKAVIVGLSDARREQSATAGALSIEDGQVLVGRGSLIEPDVLWACTTCMACVEVCPAYIEIVDDIVDMRRHLTLMEGATPGTSGTALRNMMTAGNPWGYAQAERTHWAKDLDVPVAKPGEHYDVLYFVGCSASYDKRNQRIARAVCRLMSRAGVRFAIMEQERCNAESGRRMGEEYLYQTATTENVASLGSYTFDRVVCHCPHCFNTIKNEYPQFGGTYEVVHHTQLIRELVDEGRLPSLDGGDRRVAFHDSCYLGRYNGEFEAPRATLRAAGVHLVELGRRRENGLCCGGGGGKMWFEGPRARDVGAIRMEEAAAVSPDVVGVACPFCLTMLDSARSSLGLDGIKVMDVAEILAEALDRPKESDA
jgi:Fe-S oxidoreductase